ncbi:MAG: hypothetical protein J5U17_08525 [Candidatus Methanoperedens sp.]|nr:hypothetical protein [Candidatus Methanoperedens sp.]MCE8425805.1 hypothetical protein [Candidatus Methanoperedens sp.]MCE8428162.1 hypothetical protein [Candidatus Methanoperedens sp.]
MPSPSDCARCHPDQVNQFRAGKHSLGWTKMVVAARYKAIPNDKMRASMCEGIGKDYADGGEGKCDSCQWKRKLGDIYLCGNPCIRYEFPAKLMYSFTVSVTIPSVFAMPEYENGFPVFDIKKYSRSKTSLLFRSLLGYIISLR